MPGEGAGFRGNALLHAAIARQTNNMLIENSVLISVETRRGHFRRDCDPGGVADALSKWSSRAFHTGCFAKFRMSWRFRLQLPEAFDLRHGQIVAAEMEPGVEKHTAVTGRENEKIAADPSRFVRIMF